MTTIITKNSSTASAVPVAGDLTKGELAVNVTDKKLYTKDNGGSVVKLVGSLGNQEASAVAITGGAIDGTPIGGTTASTASFTTVSASGNVTLSGGTANGVLYLNGSKVATSGSALTFDGTDIRMPNGGSILVGASVAGASFIAINGTAAAQRIVLGTSGTDGVINVTRTSGTSPNLIFQQESAELMRLTSTGLGIGTSSPAGKLQVSGDNATVYITDNSVVGSDSATLYLGLSTVPTYAGLIADFSNDRLNIRHNQATRATFDASGNLGLGVTPSAWNSDYRTMQFGATGLLYGRSGGEVAFGTNWYRDSGGTFRYLTSAAATYQAQASGIHYWFTAASGTAGDTITFSQVMTLDASGNLGVGTTSPSGRLDIQGDQETPLRVTRTTTTTGAVFLRFNNGGGNYFIGPDSSAGNRGFAAGGAAYGLVINTESANPITFGTNNIERARIDSSGNLGLGVTPSAWGGSGVKAFDIGTAGGIAGSSSDVGVLANAYYNGSSWIYKTSSLAARYQILVGTGSHAWFTAPSGTAGNAITFTQAATLTASGEFLVGKTVATYTTDGVTLAASGGSNFSNTSAAVVAINRNGTDGSAIDFYKAGTGVGSISVTGSATAYNTSSDYRLKNITGPITNSGAYIDSLNPVEGTWKADGSVFVGLIAHEVQEASRTQVATGVKDGEEMQGMDYSNSEIIANLIAEIKSLRARVAQLESN